MKISIIVAMGANRVIGINNDIPWYLPDDFNYFKEKTKGHFVLMGRKNWESLPHQFKPLPDRQNVVISRQKYYRLKGATVVSSLSDALTFANNAKENEAFIIGGGEIYRLGISLADTIYLTEIKGEFEGDITFPELDDSWIEIERLHHPADSKHAYAFDFVTYRVNT